MKLSIATALLALATAPFAHAKPATGYIAGHTCPFEKCRSKLYRMGALEDKDGEIDPYDKKISILRDWWPTVWEFDTEGWSDKTWRMLNDMRCMPQHEYREVAVYRTHAAGVMRRSWHYLVNGIVTFDEPKINGSGIIQGHASIILPPRVYGNKNPKALGRFSMLDPDEPYGSMSEQLLMTYLQTTDRQGVEAGLVLDPHEREMLLLASKLGTRPSLRLVYRWLNGHDLASNETGWT